MEDDEFYAELLGVGSVTQLNDVSRKIPLGFRLSEEDLMGHPYRERRKTVVEEKPQEKMPEKQTSQPVEQPKTRRRAKRA